MSDCHLVFPVGTFGESDADTALDWCMRELAKAFSPDPEREWAEKYGTNIENEVFLMHQQCWCEKNSPECPWCIHGDHPEFIQTLNRRFGTTEETYYDKIRYYFDPPNFWYKPTNLRVRWYKYIGRDTATNRDVLPEEIQPLFDACIKSRGVVHHV